MNDIFNEMEQLKQSIMSYLSLKNIDFETAKKEFNDVSKFSTIDDYSRMSEIFKEMEQHSNMHRNARNFLIRLNSITDGINLQSKEEKIVACVSAYLVLKSSNEYRIVVEEINKRFNENKTKGL